MSPLCILLVLKETTLSRETIMSLDKWAAVNRNNLEERYEFKAEDAEDARHWVINHLDCSKEWTTYNLEDEVEEEEETQSDLDRLIELVEDRAVYDNYKEVGLLEEDTTMTQADYDARDNEIETLYAKLK